MSNNINPMLFRLMKGKFGIAGSEVSLEWKIRYKVAVGVAEGLQYLHYDCQRRIIHRDITASNILLSEDYEAQVLLSGYPRRKKNRIHV